MVVLGVFIALPTHAAVSHPDWSKLKVSGLYNKTTQEMNVSTQLSGITREPNSDYTLTFRIDGTDYLQTFLYNDLQDTLVVNFTNFTKTLSTNYPFSYSIRSTKNTQVLYSYTGTLVFSGNIGVVGSGTSGTGTTSTGTTSTGSSWSQNEKDAQTIASIVISTIPKSITTTQGKIDYLETVIDTLQEYIVKYPARKGALDLAIAKLQVQITLYKTNTPKSSFIPKYKTRAEEPAIINGIGNSRSYNSWRAD